MKKLGMFLLGFAMVFSAAGVAQAAMSEDEDTDNKFSIHGEVRFRGEWWNNMTDFTDTGTGCPACIGNDSFDIFPYRVRLAAKGDLGHDIWVYGEFQGADVAGGDVLGQTQPLFGDNGIAGGVSLYQGWVKLKDIGNTNLDLSFGRQELVFDRGLHFSSLNFYNGISHDGVVAAWDWENAEFTAFWTRPVEFNSLGVLAGLFPSSGSDSDIYGAHAGWMFGADEDMDFAGYAFYQIQNNSFLTPGDDRGKIYTVGARWGRMVHGKSGFVWNAEGSYQFGDFQPCAANPTIIANVIPPAACVTNAFDHKAWVFEGSLGFVMHGGDTDHKFWAGYTHASGDDDPFDEDNESFQPLYTDFHNRLGYADLFTISNIQAISVGWKANVDDRHTFGAAWWMFKQAETESFNVSPLTGLTLAGCIEGVTLDGLGAPVTSCGNDDLGNELDLWYGLNVTQNFSWDTALSWFKPGDAIEDSASGFGVFPGGDDSGWRLTSQARARF